MNQESQQESPRSVLRRTNPQQNTFIFDKITISSKFDSGNLGRCNQISKNSYHLYVSEECLPYSTAGHYRTWFYFSITGVNKNENVTFSIRNMNNQGKLYKLGLKPVFKVMPDHPYWRRIPNEVNYDYGNEGFYVTFTHNFNHDSNQTVYFAFTYPFSYEDALNQAIQLEQRLQFHDKIYFHKEVLVHSIEGRKVELLTITGREKITQKREGLIEGLFPEHQSDPEQRPFIVDKPTIFLTSRVHPGETPASYVLNGILNFLTDENNEQSRVLREQFNFKIVPIINPDGVYRGYYRLDTKCQNLNRYYSNPSPTDQPTIWAIKQAIVQQQELNKLFIYVDLHAHANKKGCFMFGNNLTGESQLKNMLLPKLVSLNCVNFDYGECLFSEKMMNCKDKKDGLSREGSGRVSIWKATGIPYSYTLECNYASGKRINQLAKKLNKQTGEIVPEEPVTDIFSNIYSDAPKAPPYTMEIFEDCGRAFCISLLDLIEKNPITRIPMTTYKNLESIQSYLVSHYRILIPKKREIKDQNGHKTQTKSQTQRNSNNQLKKSTNGTLKKQATFAAQRQDSIKASVPSLQKEEEKAFSQNPIEDIICESNNEQDTKSDEEYFNIIEQQNEQESKQQEQLVEVKQQAIVPQKPPQGPKNLIRRVSEKKEQIDREISKRRQINKLTRDVSTNSNTNSSKPTDEEGSMSDQEIHGRQRQECFSNERNLYQKYLTKKQQQQYQIQILDQQKDYNPLIKSQKRSNTTAKYSRAPLNKNLNIIQESKQVVAPITNFRMPSPTFQNTKKYIQPIGKASAKFIKQQIDFRTNDSARLPEIRNVGVAPNNNINYN